MKDSGEELPYHSVIYYTIAACLIIGLFGVAFLVSLVFGD